MNHKQVSWSCVVPGETEPTSMCFAFKAGRVPSGRAGVPYSWGGQIRRQLNIKNSLLLSHSSQHEKQKGSVKITPTHATKSKMPDELPNETKNLWNTEYLLHRVIVIYTNFQIGKNISHLLQDDNQLQGERFIWFHSFRYFSWQSFDPITLGRW